MKKLIPRARAILPQPLAEVLHHLLVRAHAIFPKRHLLHPARLRVNQSEIAESGWRQFLRRENLHGVDLKPAPHQRRQTSLITRRIQEIAQYHGDARLPRLQRAAPQRFVEIRRALRRQFREVLEIIERRFPPAHRPQRAAHRRFLRIVRKRNHAHAVKTAQRHVAHRRRNLPREIKFARFAERHGFARIEKNPHRQLALLLVKFQEQPVQPPVKVPIQITKIVPRHVIAVVRELDRLPARLAPPLPARRAFRPPRRQQLKLLQPPQQFGSEEGVGHEN